MTSQGMVILTAVNSKIWRNYVKYQFFSCASDIWRLVCEGCGKDPIIDEVFQQDAQARCIIYNKFHDDYLKRLVGLKYAKGMWDKLESIFGDRTKKKWWMRKRTTKRRTRRRSFKNKNLINKSLIPLVHMVQLMMRRDQKILNPKV